MSINAETPMLTWISICRVSWSKSEVMGWHTASKVFPLNLVWTPARSLLACCSLVSPSYPAQAHNSPDTILLCHWERRCPVPEEANIIKAVSTRNLATYRDNRRFSYAHPCTTGPIRQSLPDAGPALPCWRREGIDTLASISLCCAGHFICC